VVAIKLKNVIAGKYFEFLNLRDCTVSEVKESLLIVPADNWRNNAAVKAYCSQVFQNTIVPGLGTQFTVTHPEDVTPGLTVKDITYFWHSDFTRYKFVKSNPTTQLGPIHRASRLIQDFQMPTKAQFGTNVDADVGFLVYVFNGGSLTVPPNIIATSTYLTSAQGNGIGGGLGVGTAFTAKLGTCPIEWLFEFQSNFDASWRPMSVGSSAGTRSCDGVWSGAEVNKGTVNVTIRPYWAFNPSVKGTSMSLAVT